MARQEQPSYIREVELALLRREEIKKLKATFPYFFSSRVSPE
jgi:hypothetical protein